MVVRVARLSISRQRAFGERLAVALAVDMEDVLGGAVQVVLRRAIGEWVEAVADPGRVEHDHFSEL